MIGEPIPCQCDHVAIMRRETEREDRVRNLRAQAHEAAKLALNSNNKHGEFYRGKAAGLAEAVRLLESP